MKCQKQKNYYLFFFFFRARARVNGNYDNSRLCWAPQQWRSSPSHILIVVAQVPTFLPQPIRTAKKVRRSSRMDGHGSYLQSKKSTVTPLVCPRNTRRSGAVHGIYGHEDLIKKCVTLNIWDPHSIYSSYTEKHVCRPGCKAKSLTTIRWVSVNQVNFCCTARNHGKIGVRLGSLQGGIPWIPV